MNVKKPPQSDQGPSTDANPVEGSTPNGRLRPKPRVYSYQYTPEQSRPIFFPPETAVPNVHRLPPSTVDGNPATNMLINKHLEQWRPRVWEDDISRNALDDAPFENLAPIFDRERQEFKHRDRHVPDQLLGGRDFWEMVAKDSFAIPGVKDREGYSPDSDCNYWLSGLADYLKIMNVADRLGVSIRSFFDFGCASGRVLRHFCTQNKTPQIWGSDINARHIRWICENLPMQVRAISNHCVPALPIPDNSMDVISAFSVFTHIDTFENCWLAELHRILRPGGFAYVTVHNEATWEVLRSQRDNPKNRLVKSMRNVDPESDRKLDDELPKTRTVFRFTDFGPYRAQVFHSNKYLRQIWARFFKIEEILPLHHVRQTVVILRKK